MSNFSTYKIGRNADMDIRIDDPTVSRIHAELVVTAKGEFYLTDCDSSGGSYVARNGEWIPIRQDFISPTDVILLGRYQTTASQLIAMVARDAGDNKGDDHSDEERTPLPIDDLPEGPVRRKIGTGEIIQNED